NVLVKTWCHGRILRVARPNAEKRAAKIAPAYKDIAVSVHVQGSPHWRERNTNGRLPRYPVIGRPTELPTEVAGRSRAPNLVLEAVAGAAGLINREPLFISSSCVAVGLEARPGLPKIQRAVHVIAEGLKKAEVEKVS